VNARSDADAGRWRRLVARGLVVLASFAIVLALVAAYAWQSVRDSDQFANRATAALRDPSVRSLIATKITDDVVLKKQADLLAARPLIESVTSDIVGGRAFTGLFHEAVEDAHRALFRRDQNTVTLTISDIGTVLAAAVQRLQPALAQDLRSTQRVEVLRNDLSGLSARLARVADQVKTLALLLAVLAVVLVAAALVISRDRRATVVELGVGAAIGGIVLVVAYAIARSHVTGEFDTPEEEAAARAVWDAFLGDLRMEAWILAGAGAVVAASAASLIEPRPFGDPLRVAGRWIAREPERTVWRVVRGAALVAAGIAILADRNGALTALVTVLAIYLIYEGASALLRLVYKPGERELARERARAGAHRVRRLAALAIPAGLIAGVIALFLAGGGGTTAAPSTGGCNGREELCDRPFDEVALAATHNAMSVPLPGWFSAEQEVPIGLQLQDGIRGLLVDTHYADKLPNGRFRTFFGSEEDLREQARRDGVSPDAVAAAERIRDRLGFAGEGERGMYLCHTFCELGATTLESVLRDMRLFLVANPGAVVAVINQDYVTPEDFVGAVRDADLEEFAYDGPVDGDWPTLGEMVESGKRLVLLAENHAGAAPWYRLAYRRATEETPYTFRKVALLNEPENLEKSCRPNRGPEEAPLFLINHWISTDPVPRPSDAAKVNAYDRLLARVRECRRVRDHRANLVAVNFYREGDVFRVVDTLNGVGR
jgi:hypothetical protein